MAPITPETTSSEQQAIFEAEINRWFPETDWLASRARLLPDELASDEEIEAVGVGSVISGRGETHGVIMVTDRRVVCQGFSEWARWECARSAIALFEPSTDEVTFYRVHSGDAVIQVLRGLGPQGHPDAPMGRAFRAIAAENRAEPSLPDEGRSDSEFARECLKRSMPSYRPRCPATALSRTVRGPAGR